MGDRTSSDVPKDNDNKMRSLTESMSGSDQKFMFEL